MMVGFFSARPNVIDTAKASIERPTAIINISQKLTLTPLYNKPRRALGDVQEVRINHGGHGVPLSFDMKITFFSVKLRVLRGKKFFLDSPRPMCKQ